MNITFSKKAEESYKKLPLQIQKKADKQLNYLLADFAIIHFEPER